MSGAAYIFGGRLERNFQEKHVHRSPDAMIFDLDGVITFTAKVHDAAWKELFDSYLQKRAAERGEKFVPFDPDLDYHRYVDGKPRYDGVQSFLKSRGIELPFGTPADPPTAETVTALGNYKDELFKKKVQQLGVDVDDQAIRLVRELRDRAVRVGLASSSKNAVPILEKVGVLNLFEAVVDGNGSERLGLHGKPAPDIFLQCLSELVPNANPQRAGIVEDAIAGVEAGRNGNFGLVLGVDRNKTAELARHGANWVVQDFSEITAEQIIQFFAAREQAA
jgi:alpha,alpha-trehalase